MVPLALWSNNVPPIKCCAIADCLLAVKPAFSLPSPQDRFGSRFGKPKFQEYITLATTINIVVATVMCIIWLIC